MQIQNTLAVITGGASGMGAATARYLAAKGANIAIFDRNLEAAKIVAQEVNGQAYAVDVTDAHSIEQAFALLQAEQGTPRICVNCAGIAPAKRIVGKDGPMPLADFSQVIQINLIGSFNVLRIAAAAMSALEPCNDSGERGIIINTASIAAFEGQIGQAAYSASKGGVVAMTLPAARELARFGVRVMTIAPGLVATPMLTAMPEAVQQSLAAQVPFPHRLAKPEEFAMLAAHIIENSMLNGEVIRLDGAMRMQEK